MKFIKNTPRLFLCGFVLLLIFLFSADISLACSCARPSTVDIAFDRAPTVAILKFRSVEKFAEGEEGYNYGGIKQSKLTVEKVFKGNLQVGQELNFAQGSGGNCVWTFREQDIGTEFLLYLGEKPKGNIWSAGTCSRSTSLKYAMQDLNYIEKVAEVRGKTRLSGRLTQNIRTSINGQESSHKLLAGKKVIITGNGKNIELKTDENGVYEIYDLLPGNYKITPERINGYKNFRGEIQDSIGVEIKAKTHTEQNLTYIIDNRIRGNFFDANGKSLKDVCLKLLPVRGENQDYFFTTPCTDATGKFEIKEIPAGTYVIVINDDGEISASEPFGTFYYPSALKREDAAEITIGAGDFFDDLIINAPQTAETITISGILLFEDGKTANKNNAEYSSVEFVIDREEKQSEKAENIVSRATIDENGRFTIKILKGQKGKLQGSLMTYEGKYENCPKLDKIMSEAGDRSNYVKTQAVEIEAINDLSGIELKFPFPACKLKSIE